MGRGMGIGLDDEALRVFANKGCADDSRIPQRGNDNAVKVRRVMQLTSDLTGKPFSDLRILDLACGEGVYSIEAGLRGAEVIGIDGRTERMQQGNAIAARLKLQRVRFEQQDIRNVSQATHGAFDVVYLLGILYHLHVPDVFNVLTNVRDLARALVVIDTHIALRPETQAEHRGRTYAGRLFREHEDADEEAVRRARLLASLDTTFSFWFTKPDIVRLLVDLGFTAVLEAHAPLEPGKPDDRITLVAMKGEQFPLAAYPWINDLSEDAIEEAISKRAAAAAGTHSQATEAVRPESRRQELASLLNRILRRTFRVELKRVKR